jgi:hypothetical protein
MTAILPKERVEPLSKTAFLFEEALAADLSSGTVRLPAPDPRR